MPSPVKPPTPALSASSLEIPSGLPLAIQFLRPRLLAYFKVQEHESNPRPLDLKGVVMEVLGPKCNERSSTLTPLSGFCCCSCCALEGRRCGKEEALGLVAEDEQFYRSTEAAGKGAALDGTADD